MEGPGQQESVGGKNSASKEIKAETDSVIRKKETGCQHVNRNFNANSSSSSNSSSSFLDHVRCDVSSDMTNEKLDNDGVIIPSNGIKDLDQETPNCLPHNMNTNGLDSKTNKIKQIVEDAISPNSKQTVMNILDQVNQLTTAEKLLLYLKLPTGKSANVDPLRQPLNPLGSRFEIHQTITWIKTHLEEDQDVSLPKQDVYDEYIAYCNTNMMKPLSTADFGKVMKQVFPRVRPRRLGTRGNSRYCYAGMRKRMKLEPPLLPDIGDHGKSSPEQCSEDEVVSAASCLIREWAEKLLGVRFDSLRDLACHLVEKMCVDSRSVAAFTLLSTKTQTKKCNGKGSTSPLVMPSVPPGGQAGKHRETQLQLQRKLQEREVIREQKRKLQDQQQSAAFSKGQPLEKLKAKRAKLTNHQNGREKKGHTTNTSTQGNSLPPMPQQLPTSSEGIDASVCDNTTKVGAEVRLDGEQKERKTNHLDKPDVALQQPAGSQLHFPANNSRANMMPVTNVDKKPFSLLNAECVAGKRPVPNLLPADASTNSKYCTTFCPVSEVCTAVANNNPIVVTSTSTGLPLLASSIGSPPRNGPVNKLPIPRVSNCNPKPNVIIFPTTTITPQKPVRKKYKPIQPKPKVEDKPKTKSEEEQDGLEVGIAKCLLSEEGGGSGSVKRETASAVSRDVRTEPKCEMNVASLEKDTLDEYLHGGNNSQEHEEEIIRYFQHQTSSSSNEELDDSSAVDSCKSDKLSQLRLLLERNLNPVPAGGRSNMGVFKPSNQDSSSSALSMVAAAEEQASNDDVFLSNTSVQIPSVASASASLSLLSQRSQMQQQNSRNVTKSGMLLPSLLTNGPNNNSSGLSTRRRVSFETSVMEHYHQEHHQHHTVPPSPNTRRRIFSFTPISPGPHSPISTAHQRTSSKPSSANASPFVSPRNTPVPRTRHTAGQNCGGTTVSHTNGSYIASVASQTHGNNAVVRSRLTGSSAAKIVRSNSVNSSVPTTQYQPARPRALSSTTPIVHSTNGLLSVSSLSQFSPSNIENSTDTSTTFTMPGELQLSVSSLMPVGGLRNNCTAPPMSPLSISAPQSPMVNFSNASTTVNCNDPLEQEQGEGFSASESLLQAVLQSTTKPQQYNSDTYLSQEANERALRTFEASMGVDLGSGTVQQQQPLGSDPLAHEVSQFFPDDSSDRHGSFVQFQYRSQSVPLHRMASASTHVSPLCTQPSPLYLSQQPSFTFSNFASSATSSVAPTPVPSECMDFVGVSENPNTPSTNILMVDGDGNDGDPDAEGFDSENLNRIFNLLDDARDETSQQQASLSLTPGDVTGNLQTQNQQAQRPLLQPSRSYPNTPVPYKSTSVRDPVVTSFMASATTVEANPGTIGSRSLPPTPLLSMPLFGSSDDDAAAPFQSISESDAALTLNALNTRSCANGASFAARRNISALLEEELTLETLEALQECDTFSQLVGDVEQPCSDT